MDLGELGILFEQWGPRQGGVLHGILSPEESSGVAGLSLYAQHILHGALQLLKDAETWTWI